jgi:hypothetical protein
MKIIGKGEGGKLICEISEDEVAEVFNHYSMYSANRGKTIINTEVGKEINLGAGYDFLHDIETCCIKMTSAFESFKKAQDSMISFASLATKHMEEKP